MQQQCKSVWFNPTSREHNLHSVLCRSDVRYIFVNFSVGSRINEDRPFDLLQNFHFTSRYPIIKFFDLHHFCIKRLVCFKLRVTDGLLND